VPVMGTTQLPGGFLVVIEGIDGSGKTTLAAGLRQALADVGVTVNVSKEPTAGPWGQKLRDSAKSGRLTVDLELEYLIRDRRDHVQSTILPALDREEVVILDRYFPSMVAYQGSAGLPVDGLMELNDFAPRPELLLLLDVDPAIGLGRIRARGDIPNSFETESTLRDCRAIFLDLDLPKVVIDASRPADEVLAQSMFELLLAITRKAERTTHSPVEAAKLVQSFIPSLQVA
jgi:dTMP kinase